jgi:hypothetical protein
MASKSSVVPIERIQGFIYLVRGEKAILDEDLARLYEVETEALFQAMKRNIERFPDDFFPSSQLMSSRTRVHKLRPRVGAFVAVLLMDSTSRAWPYSPTRLDPAAILRLWNRKAMNGPEFTSNCCHPLGQLRV